MTLRGLLVAGILVSGAVFTTASTVEAAPVTCSGQRVTIKGTNGSNTITGTNRRDVINGLGGSDIIHGLGGDDLICGGSGHDRIYGGTGRDRLYGGVGDDALWGEKESDRLYGQRGNDLLDGGAGRNFGSGTMGVDTCLRLTTTALSRCEPSSIARQFEEIGSSTNWLGTKALPPATPSIKGYLFRNSFYTNVVDFESPKSAEFNLGRRYRRLVLTMGWQDMSDVHSIGVFAVYGDGVDPIWRRTVRFGQTRTVTIDVTGVRRLRLQIDPTQDDEWAFWGWPTFASPYVSANPFMVPEKGIINGG
jgi:Ca2+-binding RTX toxin-like protein